MDTSPLAIAGSTRISICKEEEREVSKEVSKKSIGANIQKIYPVFQDVESLKKCIRKLLSKHEEVYITRCRSIVYNLILKSPPSLHLSSIYAV